MAAKLQITLTIEEDVESQRFKYTVKCEGNVIAEAAHYLYVNAASAVAGALQEYCQNAVARAQAQIEAANAVQN